jgi:hypothetical protein
VTIYKKVERAFVLQLGHCNCAKPSAFVARPVFAARIGAALSETGCPIRMKRTKCPDCKTIPHHRPDYTIASVFLLTKPVAVLHP